jgi:hypothetical protein
MVRLAVVAIRAACAVKALQKQTLSTQQFTQHKNA